MKILLISPVKDIEFRTKKGLLMPQLALYIIQGLTPKEHQVEIVDEEYGDEIDFTKHYDLVAISCMTANAPRAYTLATEFRKKGIKVVLGGVHPSILPNEAKQYCDAVAIGEAEGIWSDIVADAKNNTLKSFYHKEEPDLTPYVPKDYSALRSKHWLQLIPIMTTRGCPYNCDFCSVANLFGKKIRHIPIENVVRDIKESKSKRFMFLDDNIIGNKKYAKELFKALIPLKINWLGQSSISFANDTELMELAAKSGCKGLFIGLESVCESSLKYVKKTHNHISDLEAALARIRKMGIMINASVIFGFDYDTKESFKETVDFLIRNKLNSVTFNILTPYPGTKVFEDLNKQERLISKDWKYYDHNTVVFKPTNMSAYDLQLSKTLARRDFYRTHSIIKRFFYNYANPLVFIVTNFSNKKQVKVEFEKMPRLKEMLTKHL
ncbi:MAG: radical SAM protein [Bacteroidales bacterium]